MAGLVMDLFHLYIYTASLGPGEPGGYLALPRWAALLGEPLFCRLFFFLYGYFQNLFLLFYLSYWLRLLSIVRGNVESNPAPGSDKEGSDSNIRGLHANLVKLAVTGSDFDILVCAESKVSDRRHLSELRIPGFGCPNRGCGTPLLLVPRVWLFMIGEDSAPSGRASWSVLAMNPVYFVFTVG